MNNTTLSQQESMDRLFNVLKREDLRTVVEKYLRMRLYPGHHQYEQFLRNCGYTERELRNAI